MKEDYLDAVHQIYMHYILNTTATFHARQLSREEMRKIVFSDSDKYKTFVVLDADQVCGYALISQHKNREAYDETAEISIYLQTGYAGKGLGSFALKHVEDYARQQQLHVLIATICGENEASIRLFSQNGYEKCAHYREVGQKFGQRLDIVAYQKIL
jgi:phosphinothricin acetyltransferase